MPAARTVTRWVDTATGRAFVGAAATWRSPLVTAEPFTSLVPFWGVDAGAGAWVRVEARVVADDGARSGWHTVAVWSGAEPPSAPTRTSVPGPADAVAAVDADTVVGRPGVTLAGWQVQVLLAHEAGCAAPTLRMAGASAAAPLPVPATPSAPAVGDVEVPVPAYSQRHHVGRHPHWGGGGAAWCSPTSLAMALDALGAGPTPDELAWVGPGPRPQVVHAVRGVYDAAYGGAGSWAFGTAHAWTRGLDAHVARPRTLADVEPLLAQGLPVVVSTRFARDELPGAGYGTDGHLMLLVGVTAKGDPVLHDPNSHEVADDDRVRVVYPRLAFEQAMARAGGVAYVLRPR